MKCSECYYGETCKSKIIGNYYYCHLTEEYIEECIAEDDKMGCDGFVDYRNVNTTKKP